MATSGNVLTMATTPGASDKARILPSGHYVVFFPGNSPRPNTLVLYDWAGNELASHREAVRDFAAAIAPGSGEIWVQWSPFNDDKPGWPWRRWHTGIVV